LAGYRVNLDIFAGPLDLLLYLVRKEEVDIYDIPITKITDQYISYIEMLKNFDIDLAGDFLVMAATLMQIKSAMLLPPAEAEQKDEGDLGDPRAELIRQLLEYKKFKDAANRLGDVANEQKQRYPRPDTIVEKLKPNAEPSVDIEQVSIWDLLEAFDTIIQATGSNIDMSHIADDTPIDLYQIEILHRLQTEGSMNFERIFEAGKERIVLIGMFLAILELIREKLIWGEQDESSGAVYLKSLTDEPAEQAVQNAIFVSDTEDETESQIESELPIAEAIQIVEVPAKGKQTASIKSPTENQHGVVPIVELPSVPDRTAVESNEKDAANLTENQ